MVVFRFPLTQLSGLRKIGQLLKNAVRDGFEFVQLWSSSFSVPLPVLLLTFGKTYRVTHPCHHQSSCRIVAPLPVLVLFWGRKAEEEEGLHLKKQSSNLPECGVLVEGARLKRHP